MPQAFVVAAGLEGSFATSQNAGETWVQVKLPVNGDIVAITASDPLNITITTKVRGESFERDRLYKENDSKLLISRDGGKRWTEISMPSGDFETRDLETTGAGKIWLLQAPTEQAIRTAAYYQWLSHRGNSNDDKTDWYTAQQRLLTRGLQYTPDFGGTWIAAEVPPFSFDSLRRADSDEVFLLSGVYGCASAELFENRIKISDLPHPAFVNDHRCEVQAPFPYLHKWSCDAVDRKTIVFCGAGAFFTATHDLISYASAGDN